MFVSRWIPTGVVAAFALICCALPATRASADESRLGEALIEAGVAQPPRGFMSLCERRSELCPWRSTALEVGRVETAMIEMFGAASLEFDPPQMTAERFWSLKRVNAAVNARMRPVSDPGGDHWAFSSRSGDCEEYVLMKRAMLAKLGWPRAALRVAVVSTGADADVYHAVLVVSTKAGDFVLDNRDSKVRRIGESPYRFLVAESLAHPGSWTHVHR